MGPEGFPPVRVRLLARFRNTCSGNVAIIFALAAPVLVAGTGIAVDMSRLQTQNLRVQKSLDAAALAAAKEYGKTQNTAKLTKIAEDYFFLNLGRDEAQPTSFRFDGAREEDGKTVVKVSATRKVPMYFGQAITQFYGGGDKSSFTLEEFSEIVVQNRSIEMALVLDNSGSMRDAPAGGGPSKIVTLRKAATELVGDMMKPAGANVEFPVSVSVVPFSGAVNVDASNRTKSWMDTKGLSPEHHDDLDWSRWLGADGTPLAKRYTTISGGTYWREAQEPSPYLTRFYLYDQLDQDWEGCVMSRPDGLAVTDDAPTESRPATLFVPTFAPSELYRRNDRASHNSWLPGEHETHDDDLTTLQKQADVTRYLTGHALSDKGPNFICNSQPITPLTTNMPRVTTSISRMEPSGGTNIMEGLAWGWRSLTSREPFSEGRPNGTPDNLKVLVLMTDGENTYNASNSMTGIQVEMKTPGRSLHGTYGYAQILTEDKKGLRPGRMFDSTQDTSAEANITQVTAAMNENMSTVCRNMKADGRSGSGSDGIVVFTIAFDLKDGSPVKDRLRECASNGLDGHGDKLYYDARNAADLQSAFGSIMDEISSLRIAR